jgi:hypothetical protein
MLKIRIHPYPKGSFDFQQFSPFRDGAKKTVENLIAGVILQALNS